MTKSPETRIRNKKRLMQVILGAAVIVLATFIAYVPAMKAGFIWDDDRYLTANPLITAPGGLRQIWLSLNSPSQYFPLVYTSFRLEHALWGMDPFGYHLVNVILHAMNALLIWLLLSKLSIRGAWLAAAIFALHPVNVESVAWITERKNTLSTLFYLLTILAWLKSTDKSPDADRYYKLAFGLFALSLFAKTTACTLPIALLLIEYLRGNRITMRRVMDIVPFAGLALFMGLVSVWWEHHNQGTVGARFDFSIPQRLLIASRAVWFYLGKLVWPAKLTFSYPKWGIDASSAIQYIWLAACIVAAGALYRFRGKLRGVNTAAMFFVASLVPTLGFFSLYTFRFTYVADHYQYVAAIGPIALFAAMISKLRKPVNYILPILILSVLGGFTWRQTHAYADLETLWTDTLAKNPESELAHHNLATILQEQGRYEEALTHLEKALKLDPTAFQVHQVLANCLVELGKRDEAIKHYEAALKLCPNYPGGHFSLANVLAQQNDYDGAIAHYKKAIELDCNYAEAHYNLGILLNRLGRIEESAEEIDTAIRLDPALGQP